MKKKPPRPPVQPVELLGEPPDPIRLRELPGVAELELALHVPGWHLLKEYDNLKDRLDRLSVDLFGITTAETNLTFGFDDWRVHGTPTMLGQLTPEAMERLDQWERAFDFLDYEYDGEAETFWRVFGWDVTDGAGNELLIMEFLGRPLTAVVKRLHSKARCRFGEQAGSDQTNFDSGAEAEAWGRALEEQARTFKPSR